MSDVTEVNAFFSESLQSCNQNPGVKILEVNPVSEDLPSTLQLPEELIQESDRVVQLTTLGLQSSAVENDKENGNYPPIYPIFSNYQKCGSNQSFTVDLNVQTIINPSVNEDFQILDHNPQAFERCEVNLDPVMKASEEKCGYKNLLKQKSLQELNQQDENKNLALIPHSSVHLTSQTGNSNNPSEEQHGNEQYFMLKSWQELKQQDENKNLARIPNQTDHIISHTNKSYKPSEGQLGNEILMKKKCFQEWEQQDENKNLALIQHSSIPLITDNSNNPSEEQRENEQYFMLKSWQELKQPDKNKNLALIPNKSVHPISQIDKSYDSLSVTISTSTEIETHTEFIQSSQIPAPVNVDAPMLTYLLVKVTGSESKSEESLIFLDCIKRILKWFAKLNELNQYNTVRFQALLEKMIDFQRLESLVKEKQEMITIGKDLSLSEFQTMESSDFEMSTYRTLYVHCERVSRLLKFYERYLNAAYERHRKLRTKYLECSLQIAMYPIEEKLFENRTKTMNILNQSSTLMNKISLKLEETDNFTDNLSFECIAIVNNFFRDCEVTFSQ